MIRPVYTFTVLTTVRYGLSRFPRSWRTVMNRGQNQVFYGCLRITTVLLRFPTTSVRCFYEFMPDCAGYDHGLSRFITAVLRSVTVLLRFDTVLLRFLTVVLRLITMPLRFDTDGAGTCTVVDGRRDDDHVTVWINYLPSTSSYQYCFGIQYAHKEETGGIQRGRERKAEAIFATACESILTC